MPEEKNENLESNEEHHHYEVNNWDDLLKFTRRNYLKTVEELTKLQEETETTLKKLIETGTSYTKESSNVIKNWVETINGSLGKFQKNTQHLFTRASDRAAKELNINIPFKKEVEELVDTVQKNIKSIFEKFRS
jgi:DNA-binding protein H-NS